MCLILLPFNHIQTKNYKIQETINQKRYRKDAFECNAIRNKYFSLVYRIENCLDKFSGVVLELFSV